MDNLNEEYIFDFTKSESNRELILQMEANLSIPEERKIKQLFAHEIGHLVGLLINNELTEPFGIPRCISFEIDNPRFSYDWTDGVFCVRRDDIEKDFYGLRGYGISGFRKDCQQTQDYIKKTYNLKRLPPYISYLILGGLFHLYFDSRLKGYQIEERHFDKIFSDENDGDVQSIMGAAGADWTSVRMYCGEYKIPYEIIIEYRQKLYNACLEFGLFNHFELEIDNLFKTDKLEYTAKDMEDLVHKLTVLLKTYLCKTDFLKRLDDLNHLITDNI